MDYTDSTDNFYQDKLQLGVVFFIKSNIYFQELNNLQTGIEYLWE